MINTNKIVTDLNYMQDPLGRVRFHGIYSGRVVDVKDPLNKGRIKMQIPQVTGTQTSKWAPQVGGGISQINYPYGTFITTASQSLTQNAATVVNNWVGEDLNKARVNGTKLYVDETGDYFFQFSIVFAKASANTSTADVWIRKNGTNVPNSNTTVHLAGSNAEVCITVGFILDLNAGDYIELVATSPATDTSIRYHAAASTPTRPAVPGVIATINLVGKFVPKVGSNVWVMFEGGDPEFPVWLGAKA